MVPWLLIAGLLLTAPCRSAEGPLVLVLGDSLSSSYGLTRDQGWVGLLAGRLSERGLPHRVFNASVSGDTTAGGLTRLPSLLERHRPAVLIIQLGANDGLRGLRLEEIQSNLARLVRLGTDSGARVLLVGVRLPPNYGAAYTQGFQAIFPAVAERQGVPLIPRLLAGVAERWDLMQPDGLHPTGEAQPLILENIWVGLEPLLLDSAVGGGESAFRDGGRLGYLVGAEFPGTIMPYSCGITRPLEIEIEIGIGIARGSVAVCSDFDRDTDCDCHG